MKHAFLILAHTDFAVLHLLLDSLDDPRNDIFVHFDRKVRTLPSCHTERAGLFILKQRVDVRWGDYSMVEAELALFQAARGQGPYHYYHLLSGVDLPLKSQNFIHSFFDEHDGQEFVGYTTAAMTPMLSERMQRWYMYPCHFRSETIVSYHFRQWFLRLQRLMNLHRNRGVSFGKGPQWVSVTDHLAQELLSRKRWIKKTFTHTFCPDESLFQTFCLESPFREKVYYPEEGDDVRGSCRFVGWRENGSLQDWDWPDLDALKSSEALFARKFNSRDLEFLRAVLQFSGEK